MKNLSGKKETLIEGKMYTSPPQKRWSKNPSKGNGRKLPVPREMYCTVVKEKDDLIEKLFINAWNRLADHPEEIKLSDDPLKDYRAGEMKCLLAEYGKIDEIKIVLVKQTLDHISVDENGEAVVIFLSGSVVSL